MRNWCDIYLMTTPEGFDEMREIAFKLKNERGIPEDYFPFPLPWETPEDYYWRYGKGEDYFWFMFEDICQPDWDEEHQDVKLFMDTLRTANDSGIKWQFLRIGPRGLIEEKASDNFFDNPTMVMRVGVTEVSFYRP